jgi:hypothetical protein
VNRDPEDLTAYCGLFCLDCIPSNKPLFDAIRELARLASKIRLDLYAGARAANDNAFDNYPDFARMLDIFSSIECPAPCRREGGREQCDIRDCAVDRGFKGCWECDARPGCERLDRLRSFHGETIDNNLDAITEYGISDWTGHRGKHYPWS